ncbi:MAG: flp pilus-assembly TadE/G-like family protein [Actinomycetota bacterium]|nr:flp pilus-assembly TadE/G-like family protein [Actinomycetota bacterium]
MGHHDRPNVTINRRTGGLRLPWRPLGADDQRGDRGAASLWVLGAGVLVLTTALLVATRTAAVTARHRAGTAADLAALAAAGQIGRTADSAAICRRAAEIAQADGARLTTCTAQLAADGRSGTVRVEVTISLRLAGLGPRPVSARARAGRLPSGARAAERAAAAAGRWVWHDCAAGAADPFHGAGPRCGPRGEAREPAPVDRIGRRPSRARGPG